MAYQALYRQWRPMTFEEVVGQENIVKTLRHQIESDRIAHAYLFCGCRGTGKTTLAKIMSRAINCLQSNHGDPCGNCEVCKAILSETTLDVLELDAASNNSVDNIRDLLEQVCYPAQVGRYKVYIIDEVHMLSTAAFNALLKTLEEPPPHVVFILATTEPQKLPATILSRVQRYDFGRIPFDLMIERMQMALTSLSVTADIEALQMVARAAEGAMRDAFSILDMCVAGASGGHISAGQTREILGASDRDFLFSFAESIADRNCELLMRQVDSLMRAGREPQVFLREMIGHFRALLTANAVSQDVASLLDITPEDEKRYRTQEKKFSQERLLRILSLFMRAEGELRFASTPRIGLEVASLQACEAAQGEDSAALLERLSEMEQKLKAFEAAFQSGKLISSPAKTNESAAIPTPSAKAPVEKTLTPTAHNPQKESSTDANDPKSIWQKTITAVSKVEPPLFGLLRGEKFLGAQGNVYQLLIPFAKKDFSYFKLSQPSRLDRISQILSEVAGTPCIFQPVLEGQQTSNQDAHDQMQNLLVEAFGRDLVQIDDEETDI